MKAKKSGELLALLKARFEKNMKRHAGLDWAKVQKKLEASPALLATLAEMEATGGEPDVVGQEEGAYLFVDCAAESYQER